MRQTEELMEKNAIITCYITAGAREKAASKACGTCSYNYPSIHPSIHALPLNPYMRSQSGLIITFPSLYVVLRDCFCPHYLSKNILYITCTYILFACPVYETLSHKVGLFVMLRHAFWKKRPFCQKPFSKKVPQEVEEENVMGLISESNPEPFKVKVSYLHNHKTCPIVPMAGQIPLEFFSLFLKTPYLTILNILTICWTWSSSVVT